MHARVSPSSLDLDSSFRHITEVIFSLEVSVGVGVR